MLIDFLAFKLNAWLILQNTQLKANVADYFKKVGKKILYSTKYGRPVSFQLMSR
jgi:hypothetical protein